MEEFSYNNQNNNLAQSSNFAVSPPHNKRNLLCLSIGTIIVIVCLFWFFNLFEFSRTSLTTAEKEALLEKLGASATPVSPSQKATLLKDLSSSQTTLPSEQKELLLKQLISN